MIFYATSDEIAMIGILKCVSIGKATFYKKILIDLDKTEGALTSLIQKYNVSIGKATTTPERPCAGHMVIQFNQTLLAKQKCMVYLLVTLPIAVRSQAEVYKSLVEKLEVVETSKTKPEHRKRIAVQWQKDFIKKAFTSKQNPNPDDFSCLEWEHERLYIYSKDQIRKLVLRRAEYSDQQKKKQAALDAKRVEKGEKPRNLKAHRWTWNLTSHYSRYIKRIAELKIEQAMAAKKAQKRDQLEKQRKRENRNAAPDRQIASSPTKQEVRNSTRLTPTEVATCVSDAIFLVKHMPAFSGTASDIGKIVSEIEWRFNSKAIKQSKAVRAKDCKAKKIELPITNAFKIKDLASRAVFNASKFQFKYHSFQELRNAVESYREGLSESQIAQRETEIISLYEIERRRITKSLKQKNTEGAKLSRYKVDLKIKESLAKKILKFTGFRTAAPLNRDKIDL
ncbi:MAG: hypothetical protein KBT27_05905 [Prevotellaceae bacterium]|nr:hypothetical protein [Candidatus Faecinaster equi]